MTQEEKNKFEVGKWYQDRDNDFIKFKEFDRDNFVNFTARVRDNNYRDEIGSWNLTCIVKCTPMTIKEMKNTFQKKNGGLNGKNQPNQSITIYSLYTNIR